MATPHNRLAEEPDTTATNGRSMGQLLKELRDELSLLVRQEIALAKTEVGEKVSRVSRNSMYLGIGAVIAAGSVLVLLFTLVASLYAGMVAGGMSHMTAGWLSPLIITLIGLVVGYGMIQKAISTIKNESLTPERTAESLQETTQWAKDKVT